MRTPGRRPGPPGRRPGPLFEHGADGGSGWSVQPRRRLSPAGSGPAGCGVVQVTGAVRTGERRHRRIRVPWLDEWDGPRLGGGARTRKKERKSGASGGARAREKERKSGASGTNRCTLVGTVHLHLRTNYGCGPTVASSNVEFKLPGVNKRGGFGGGRIL